MAALALVRIAIGEETELGLVAEGVRQQTGNVLQSSVGQSVHGGCVCLRLLPFPCERVPTLGEPLSHGLDARLHAQLPLNVVGDAERLHELLALQFREESHQGLQVGTVRRFERIDVGSPCVVAYDQGQPVVLDEDQRCESAGEPTVAVLKRVSLREPVV